MPDEPAFLSPGYIQQMNHYLSCTARSRPQFTPITGILASPPENRPRAPETGENAQTRGETPGRPDSAASGAENAAGGRSGGESDPENAPAPPPLPNFQKIASVCHICLGRSEPISEHPGPKCDRTWFCKKCGTYRNMGLCDVGIHLGQTHNITSGYLSELVGRAGHG